MAAFLSFCIVAFGLYSLTFSSPVMAATPENVQNPEELPEIKTNVKKLKELKQQKQIKEFDHNLTGFPLRGGHQSVPCEECHIRGVFRGTPRNCIGCHTRGLGTGGSRMPANHIPTTAECDLCHTVNRLGATWNTVRMDHLGISSNCELCHNGQMASGKNRGHIPTNQPCELCHRSNLSWAVARMDHTGISANCTACHNNPSFPFAGGTPKNCAGHQFFQTGCENCHKTTSWTNLKIAPFFTCP